MLSNPLIPSIPAVLVPAVECQAIVEESPTAPVPDKFNRIKS